jgi:beta-phosphoglucomutase
MSKGIKKTERLVVFDLDGTLVHTPKLHFNSLNMALAEIGQEYVISKKEQKNIFEGLPTRNKLKILTEIKGLPETFHKEIQAKKQKYYKKMLDVVKADKKLIKLLSHLKRKNIVIGIASNSSRENLDICIQKLGIKGLIDFSLSANDVNLPKPNPEIYLKAMSLARSSTETTVIFEDNEIGIKSAIASGATTIKIKNRKFLTIFKINKALKILDGVK